MVTTRRMSTGATPAKAGAPTTPSRRRSTAASSRSPATPSGGRTPRRAAKASGSGGGGGAGADAKTKALRLVVKAMGIYVCFITWGIVQERVTTTEYQPAPGLGGRPGRYSSMITLNGAWRPGWMAGVSFLLLL